MQRESSPRGNWRHVAFPLTALIVLVADQLSKGWIRANLAVGEASFELGFFRIIRVLPNTGAVFGLFPGHIFILTIVGMVTVVTLLVCAFIIYRRFPRLDTLPGRIALGLILGGTIGNLVERLNPALGGVTDFISVGIWPTFNVADSAIVVGVIVFAFSLRSLFVPGEG